MASKSTELVLEGSPIESVIAESKLQVKIKDVQALPNDQTFELPKKIIPEINSTWSLKLTPLALTKSHCRFYTIHLIIETQSEAVWKSKYEFELNARHGEKTTGQPGNSFIYKQRGKLDQNVSELSYRERLYDYDIMPDRSIEIDITVSILHIKNSLLRSNFYDPALSSKRIVDNCLDMFENSMFSDFTFNVGNQKFKVHKGILASASPVFLKTFTSEMMESRNNECTIDKIDPDIFEHLMRFIYGGKLPENLADVSIKLYEAAHFYQIEQLMEICEQEIVLKLDVSTAQDIYQWAHVYDIEDLKLKAWQSIKNEVLKIYYPLKGEPLSPQMTQTLIARQQNEAKYWEQLRN